MEKSIGRLVDCDTIHEFVDEAALTAEEKEKLRQLRATGAMKAELEQCAPIQEFVEGAAPVSQRPNGTPPALSAAPPKQPKLPE
jgi:hypothetical protein